MLVFKSKTTARLNTYLLIFVILNIIFFYISDKSESYVSGINFEYFSFSSLVILSLLINQHVKSAALELLNIIVVIFYHFRFTTLIFISDSSMLASRNAPIDSIADGVLLLSYNFSALILATIFLLPRVAFNNIKSRNRVLPKIIIRRIFYFILFGISLQILSIIFIGDPGDRRLGIFRIIFTILSEDNMILLFFSVMFFVNKDDLTPYKKTIYLIFFLFISHYVYMGNKSAIAVLMIYYLIASLYSKGVVYFSFSQALKVMSLVALTIVLFIIGYYFRIYHLNSLDASQVIQVFYSRGTSIGNSVEFFLHRIGWLDYFLDSVLNQNYNEFVNLTYYVKSIIDGITIGFDVFNAEFVSRMLHYTINNGFNEGFKSDQLTVFAEGHIIFGVFSPVLYFVMLFLFIIMFRLNIFSNPLSSQLYGIIIMQALYIYFAGFGIDMLIVNELIYKGVFFLLVHIFILRYPTITVKKEHVLKLTQNH